MKAFAHHFIWLLLVAAPAASAQYSYTTNADGLTCTITGHLGSDGAMIIPTNIDGLTVVSIGESAFAGTIVNSGNLGEILPNYIPVTVEIPGTVTNVGAGAFMLCDNLASVTVSGSVSSLGVSAFNGCYSLSNVSLSAGLTSIGASALADCPNLAGLVLPGTVASIGDQAFASTGLTNLAIPAGVTNLALDAFFNCHSLGALTVDPGNPVYGSTQGVVFDHGRTTLLLCPPGFTGSCAVPGGVTQIGSSAFNGCCFLTSVTLPVGLTTIGDEAFEGCYDLTNVTLPDGVASIGYSAFADCTALPNITIPASVTSLANAAFAVCGQLTQACFAGNAPATNIMVFFDAPVTCFYLPGATGWGSAFDQAPTAPWLLPYPVILKNGPGLGAQTGGFGFTISWATNLPVVVQACGNLASPAWSPVATNLLVGGTSRFTDPQWTNYPSRFYRLRSP